MDIYEAIRSLHREKERLNRVIARLERELLQPEPGRKRRARKPMAEARRAEISERMKRYWAERRDANKPAPGC